MLKLNFRVTQEGGRYPKFSFTTKHTTIPWLPERELTCDGVSNTGLFPVLLTVS